MRTEQVDLKEALTQKYWIENGYKYIWKQEISSVVLTSVNKADDSEEENLLEARIFTEGKELHIFRFEDSLRAVETVGNSDDDFFEEEQLLRERFGHSITVRNYIDYDSDGQAYIIRTVLNGYNQEELRHG